MAKATISNSVLVSIEPKEISKPSAGHVKTAKVLTRIAGKLNINQSDLARKKGVTRQAVNQSLYEGDATYDTLFKYADLIGVKVSIRFDFDSKP